LAVDPEHTESGQPGNQKTVIIRKAAGKEHVNEFMVARERMRQSASILRTLGLPIPDEGAQENG